MMLHRFVVLISRLVMIEIQISGRYDGFLTRVAEWAAQRKSLLAESRLQVCKKSTNQQSRRRQFHEYNGMDDESARLLYENYNVWTAMPELFWSYKLHPSTFHAFLAMVEKCFLRAKGDDV